MLKRYNWRTFLADGVYHSGALHVIRELSNRIEVCDRAYAKTRIRKAHRAKYVILGYHSVGLTGVPVYSRLAQDTFAKQMHYIRNHYRVLSLCQLMRELADPNARGQGVIVTFDDGYRSTYMEAFPVLRHYNIPATVYLIAGAVEHDALPWYDRIFLGFQQIPHSSITLILDVPRTFSLQDGRTRVWAATEVVSYLRTVDDQKRLQWCAEFDSISRLQESDLRGWMMTWEQIRTMQRAGICFGAHTMTHPVIGRLPIEALRAELLESKRLIEARLAFPIEHFAFPFGQPKDCGDRAFSILPNVGYRSAVTTVRGVNTDSQDRFQLRRLIMGEDSSISMFAYRLSRLFFEPGVGARI